jgi:hypothetical protein
MLDIEMVKIASIPVTEITPCDEFENAIRKFGIVSSCEWFGYQSNSEFTADTIAHLARM